MEWKTLGEVCDVRDGTHDSPNKKAFGKYLITSKNVKNGSINVDSAYFISESDFDNINKRSKVDIDDLLFTMIGTVGEIAHITEEPDFAIKNVGLIKTQNRILSRYLLHYLQSTYAKDYILSNSSKGSQVFLGLGKLRNFPIQYVKPKIQSRIVQVLDNFDTVCNDLNIGLPKEIELRQKQYEYFREKLLTFVAEGEYTESRVEEWDNSAIIKLLQWVFGPIRVKLGVICDFVRGNGLQKKEFTENGKSVIHYGQIYTKYDFSVSETLSKTSEIVFKKLKKAQPNDLVIATTSENVEDVGKAIVWEGKEEIGISGDSYIIQTTQNSRYLNYWLRSTSFQSQKERKVTGTKVVRINSKDMEKFKIVLPPLTEQKRIVSILDNFNTLANSLSEGLPKEIELRQKQYEYWRNQLLNFNE